jgi:heterotetrameric sarcosine oxidase delta subunit
VRITCPYCGERDLREFTYKGAAVALDRPDPEAGTEAWDSYVFLRENPAGDTRDLWYHDPCGAWIEVHRNTVTHAVHASRPAREAAR